MIFLMLLEPHHDKTSTPEKMFDGSRKMRSLWDGVKLEVAGDRSPVVLSSFTQLDPDLPALEVRCSTYLQIQGLFPLSHNGAI